MALRMFRTTAGLLPRTAQRTKPLSRGFGRCCMNLEDIRSGRRDSSWSLPNSGFGGCIRIEFTDKTGVEPPSLSGFPPGPKPLTCEPQKRSTIVVEKLEPRSFVHLRKIDSSEKQARDDVTDAYTDRRVTYCFYRFLISLRTVASRPGAECLGLRFLDRHFQRIVRHNERREFE